MLSPTWVLDEIRLIGHVPDAERPGLIALRIHTKPPPFFCPSCVFVTLECFAVMAPTDRFRLEASGSCPFGIHADEARDVLRQKC